MSGIAIALIPTFVFIGEQALQVLQVPQHVMTMRTSEEKSQVRPRYQTTRRKTPKHMVLFIVTAPYTWGKACKVDRGVVTRVQLRCRDPSAIAVS